VHRRVGAGRAPPLQGREEVINHKTWLSGAKTRLADVVPAPPLSARRVGRLPSRVRRRS